MTTDPTYTAYTVHTPNAELPIPLNVARAHLRNEDLHFDDDYLMGVIRGVGASVERQYGLALLAQTIKQYHSAFPSSADTPLLLRITPLISVTSITYVDSAGAAQSWDNANFTSGGYDQYHFIIPKTGETWPNGLTQRPNAVTITYQAGFGSKYANIPTDIVSAMLLTLTQRYQNRENSAETFNTAADNLLRPYYRFSV